MRTCTKDSDEKERTDKWDERYLALAKFVSEWSKDPRAKVGAVIRNKRGRPVALGYNGFPGGIADDARLYDKDTKHETIIHAEQNALLIAGAQAEDGTIYVIGKPMCVRCAVLVIEAGIKRVVAEKPSLDSGSQWDRQGFSALKLFAEKGLNVRFYKELPDGSFQRALPPRRGK